MQRRLKRVVAMRSAGDDESLRVAALNDNLATVARKIDTRREIAKLFGEARMLFHTDGTLEAAMEGYEALSLPGIPGRGASESRNAWRERVDQFRDGQVREHRDISREILRLLEEQLADDKDE
jgi:hypothetical protein